MKQFSKTEQVEFWSANAEPLKGDVTASAILALADRYVGSRSIDVGGGSGSLVRSFRARHAEAREIVAVDLAPRGPDVQEGDCTALAFPDARFDTLFCTDVIEHLNDEDLDRCVREAARVLEAGGHGIFATMHAERLDESRVRCPDCGCEFHRWGHCQVFDVERVRDLFGSRGFDLVASWTLHLGLRARFPLLGRAFFGLGLQRFMTDPRFTRDLVFVVRKRPT